MGSTGMFSLFEKVVSVAVSEQMIGALNEPFFQRGVVNEAIGYSREASRAFEARNFLTEDSTGQPPGCWEWRAVIEAWMSLDHLRKATCAFPGDAPAASGRTAELSSYGLEIVFRMNKGLGQQLLAFGIALPPDVGQMFL